LIGGLVYVGAVVAAGAVVASGGTLTAVIAAAGLAGGTGLVGSVLAKWVGDHHAHYLREQIDHGGQLLWVRTWNTEDEERAVEILKRHSASEVHVHALAAET
jgi:ABC-type molybdate transport system ATPase subunit